MNPRRVVVIGNGMAGGRFVEELLARTGDGRAAVPCRISIVGAEPYGSYNRVLLSDVVAGRADVAALGITDPHQLADRGVEVLLGRSAAALDLDAQTVRLDDGQQLPYERVVLATGAEPVVPIEMLGHSYGDNHCERDGSGDPSLDLPHGVHVLRTVDDARDLVAAATNARRAMVLGGGPLGLEAARGLSRRGLSVAVVQPGPQLLPGLLDAAGGAVLRRTVRRFGIDVRVGCSLSGIVQDESGRLSGVLLEQPDTPGADLVETDLLVLACGVRPRVALAAAAGLGVARGVLVDDELTTSDPRVLAIGDCAEHDGRTSGLVAPAWDQARIAADLVSGSDPAARYRPAPAGVRLKAADIDVTSIGDVHVDPWDDDADLADTDDPADRLDTSGSPREATDVVQLLDPGRGHYVKAVIRGGVVVGAMVVGDARAAAELTLLVDRRSPAPADRAVLVLPGAGSTSATNPNDDPTKVPDAATICRCNGVTKGALVRAWTAGARSRDDLAARTRATTGCGTCSDAVEGILTWLRRVEPDEPNDRVAPRQPVPPSRSSEAVHDHLSQIPPPPHGAPAGRGRRRHGRPPSGRGDDRPPGRPCNR